MQKLYDKISDRISEETYDLAFRSVLERYTPAREPILDWLLAKRDKSRSLPDYFKNTLFTPKSVNLIGLLDWILRNAKDHIQLSDFNEAFENAALLVPSQACKVMNFLYEKSGYKISNFERAFIQAARNKEGLAIMKWLLETKRMQSIRERLNGQLCFGNSIQKKIY